MTGRGLYLTGLAVAAGIGAVALVAAPEAIRSEVARGLLIGLLVQAPLGWWMVRSIGTERFQLVWVAGIAIRVASVAIAGLILVPALGWQMVPVLGALVATLLVLLLVEVGTVVREHSGIKL